MPTTTKFSATRAAVVLLALVVTGGAARAGGLLAVEFDATHFVNPTIIDNPYWPLSPGNAVRRFTYVGEEDDECVVNVITVDPMDTRGDFAAPYDTLEAQQVDDREWVVELGDGEACDASTPVTDDDLAEWTFDWFAQDMYQNIWYLGEASRDFEDPCPSLDEVPLGAAREDWPDDDLFLECTAGSWEAGQPGQEEGEIVGAPGIVVPGDFPEGSDEIGPGTFYLQEVAEGAQDMAKILRTHTALSVEDGVGPGDYENCRKVKEWTALEPGSSVEHKWYCADGDGLVLIQGIGGGPTQDEVLVEVQ